MPGIEAGVGFVQAGIEANFRGFGAAFVALAILFFAFTTLVAYYYMDETNIAFINRSGIPMPPASSRAVRVSDVDSGRSHSTRG